MKVAGNKMSDLKRLKSIYEQYKKLNKPNYADGGSVLPEQGGDINNNMFAPGATAKPDMMAYDDRAADKYNTDSIAPSADAGGMGQFLSKMNQGLQSQPKPADSQYDKQQADASQNLSNYYKTLGTEKGYADGGDVKPQDDDALTKTLNFVKSFTSATGSSEPKPAPTPDDSREQKYAKIRQQQRDVMSGKKSETDQTYYSDGGEVEPDVSDEIADELQKGIDEDVSKRRDQGLQKAAKSDSSEEEPFYVNASKPKSIDKVEEEKLSDKAIEKPYDIENEDADLAADEKEDSDREPASEEASAKPDDNEQADIAQKGFSGKVEGINPDDLAKAQKQRDLNIAANDAARYGAIAGSGLAKVDPSELVKNVSKSSEELNMPVTKYSEQVANQQNDPNSAMSKVVGEYLTQKGFNLPAGTSAADAFKVMPFLQKDSALQVAIQKVLLQTQSRQKVADDNREAANKRAKERNIIEQQKADAMKDQKATNNQDKTMQQTKTLLESARGNPAAAQAEKDLYSVQKVNSLINQVKDPNKLSNQQINLMISEVSKIATGGVPTGHEQEALKPGTAESKLASLWSKLTNEPTPANAGAFVKQFKSYNDSLAEDAKKVIHDKYGRVIESSKKQLGEENYKALQDQYLSRFNNVGSAKGLHAPGSVVIVKGKKMIVGADGDSLEELN